MDIKKEVDPEDLENIDHRNGSKNSSIVHPAGPLGSTPQGMSFYRYGYPQSPLPVPRPSP